VVGSLRLGDARGFTLEPHIAYFPTDAAVYYNKPEDQKVYRWIWEKNWMWYFTWGRLSYDPSLPESTIVAAYQTHYGSAGPAIYHAVQAAGPIVPTVYSYRCVGLDQRDVAPETETGLTRKKHSKDKTDEKDTTPAAAFSENRPLDGRSFIGIDDFVMHKIAGKPDGRVTPVQVADEMTSAANGTRAAVAAVDASSDLCGPAADEWRLLRADLLAASHLGDYFANRVTGTMFYDYAMRTGSETDYDEAVSLLSASRGAWKALADTADAVYAPHTNLLRKQTNYRWSDKLRPIEQNDLQWVSAWSEAKHKTDAKPLSITAQDHGRDIDIQVADLSHGLVAGGKVAITCRANAGAGVKEILLWTKPLPSEAKWASLPMTAGADGAFTLTVPVPSAGLMYLVEVRDSKGSAMNYPPVMETTPYRVIPPTGSK